MHPPPIALPLELEGLAGVEYPYQEEALLVLHKRLRSPFDLVCW